MDRNSRFSDFSSEISVALHRSAWIEIKNKQVVAFDDYVALHRSAWIEIQGLYAVDTVRAVALHRSAWIEIK